MNFENKTVIITWGTAWIWKATVQAFAKAGAIVHFTGRNKNDGESLAHDTWAHFHAVDATDLQATKSFIQEVWEWSWIDVLYLNAGSAKAIDILETTEEVFDFTYNLNVKSPVMSVQYALPYLKTWSSVLFTASVAWSRGMRGFNIYGSTKAALINVAQTYAWALADKWIRINTISPGPIDTGIFSTAWVPDDHLEWTKDYVAWMTALKRLWTVGEIAQTVLFLSSDHASYITGEDIVVDGWMIPVLG